MHHDTIRCIDTYFHMCVVVLLLVKLLISVYYQLGVNLVGVN